MTSFNDAVKAISDFKGQFQMATPSWVAYLGDGNGTVQGSSPIHVYVRYPSVNSPAVEIINTRVTTQIQNVKVKVGYLPEQPNILQVLSVVPDQRLDSSTSLAFIPPHGNTHAWGGSDPTYIAWRQITDFRLYAQGTLQVIMQGGIATIAGVINTITTQPIDLSLSVPSSAGARWSLISLDSTGAVIVTDGSIQTNAAALNNTHIPATPSGNWRIWAIKLQYGQTTIDETRLITDTLDLRWPQNTGTGSVPLSDLTPGTAQYQYLVTGVSPFTPIWSSGFLNITATKTLTVQNSLTLSGADGSTLTLTTSLTNQGTAGVLNWGGAYTLTVPATGTAALLGTANVFTAPQTITLTDATTNTESNIAVLNHNSSNTTAAGFGSTLRFNLKFNNANDTAAAGITAYWSGTSISRVRIDADSGTGSLSEALTVGTNYFKALSSAPIFGAYTLTIPATGTAALGTGTTNQVTYWNGTNTVTSSANLTFDTSTLTLSNVAFYSQANGANPATFYGYSNTAGLYPYFDFRRARGSIGSPSAVNTGDILGAVNFYGRVTGGDANAASIICATAFSTGTAITPYLVFSVFAPTQNDILYCYSTGAYINTGKFLTTGGFTTPTSGFSLRSDTPAEFTANDAATSTVTTIAAIRHNSTGTPTTGFGAAQLFTLESSTTADTSAANLKVSWADATHATRKAKAVVNVYDTAERSAITFEADGAAADTYFEGGDGSGLPYGSCYGNEIGWSQASAAQNTWYIISDTDMTDATGGLNLVTHDGSGKLTVTKAGHYLVNYSVTMECSVLNKHVQTGISINGTVINDAIQHYEVATPNAQLTIGSTAVVKLAASGYVEIAVRTTDTGTPDLSVDHLNFSIVQVGG